MCFDKNSSSQSKTNTKTVNRDERIGAEAGSVVSSAKGGSTVTATTAQATEAENVFSLSPNAVVNFESTTPEVVAAALQFAAGAFEGAGQFAANTQASFQEAAAAAATQDSTELASQLMKYAALAVVAFFGFQYLGKAA